MTVKVSRPSIDIRGTLDELNKPSGIAGNAMLAAETPQEQFNLIGAGRKNLLINGSVQVWQKGTTQTKSNSYSNTGPDHMTTYYGGTYAQQSVVLPSGQEVSALRYTADTSSNACPNFNWIMEDAGKILRGQTVTISWWMRTSKPGIMMGARVNNVANSRYSGGGSYYTLGQTSGFIYEATTSWTYHSRTVALSDANTHAHGLAEIWAAGGSMSSGDWFEIAQVQLELGSVATPFEHRSYGEELALCQRYYCQSYESGTLAGSVTYEGALFRYLDGTHNWATFPFQFPTPMRLKPSMRIYNPATGALNSMSNDASNKVCGITAHGTQTARARISNITTYQSTSFTFHYTADAEL